MIKISVIILLALVILIVVCNVIVERCAADKTIDNTADVAQHECALLLGTSPFNRFGGPNAFYTARKTIKPMPSEPATPSRPTLPTV